MSEKTADPQFAVAIGNAFDGHNFYGPFNTFEEAEEWASESDETWWIVELSDPKEN